MAASTPEPHVAILRLRGENDASVAQRVRGDLASVVDRDAPVVVDLTAATSLDAAVIRALIDGLAESERLERTFLLLLPPGDASPVRRLFEISGLAGLLPVVSSWDEALVRARQAGVEPGWTSPLS